MRGSRWVTSLVFAGLFAFAWWSGAGAEVDQADAPARLYVAAAGRSPIPQPGEQIRKPLPFKRFEVREPVKVDPPAPGQIIPWNKAANYLGHEITVQGKIVDTHMLDSGNICFLNYDKNWRGKFYLALFKEAFGDLPKPQEYYLNKTIRVTGQVKLHKNVPQMEIRSIRQVKVVE